MSVDHRQHGESTFDQVAMDLIETCNHSRISCNKRALDPARDQCIRHFEDQIDFELASTTKWVSRNQVPVAPSPLDWRSKSQKSKIKSFTCTQRTRDTAALCATNSQFN